MDDAAIITALEAEWSLEHGFFWQVRGGIYSAEDFTRVLRKLSAISFPPDAKLPLRLVSLLWYIPLFLEWQTDRVREKSGDVAAYARAISAMTNEIERILGVL